MIIIGFIIGSILLFLSGNVLGKTLLSELGNQTNTDAGFGVFGLTGTYSESINFTILETASNITIQYYLGGSNGILPNFLVGIQESCSNLPCGYLISDNISQTNDKGVGIPYNITFDALTLTPNEYWITFLPDSNTGFYRLEEEQNNRVRPIMCYNPLDYWNCGAWIDYQSYFTGTNIKMWGNLAPKQLDTPILSTCNLSYTKDSTNTFYDNITLSWNNIVGASYYELNLSNSYSYSTTETIYNISANDLSVGNYHIYISSKNDYDFDGISNMTNCSLNICENSYIETVQPCIDGIQLLLFKDINNCNKAYNIPLTNNTYQFCVLLASQGENKISNSLYTIALSIIVLSCVFIYKRGEK
jgi:hypothetical protein